MIQSEQASSQDFVLPPSVVTSADVARLLGEFEKIDNDLVTASIHSKTGGPKATVPTVSRQLTDFLSHNRQDLADARARTDLISRLKRLKDSVPVIHVTFSAEADPESLQQLVAWLRQSIHEHTVIEVGFQPSLIAGVYLRTPNHVHDLSLRAKLRDSHGLIKQELGALNGRV